MSRVSYFQRFAQRENHATNNALLLLRYFYEESPSKLQKVLNAWIDAPVEIGLTFQQQVKRASSVPDGYIEQSRLPIYFETKHGGGLWRDQIERHIDGIAPAQGELGTVLLIGLTKEPSAESEETRIREVAKAKGVLFRGVTFSQIVDDLRAVCAPHDENLLRILDDFQSFLAQEGLLDDRAKRMAVFPCGTSAAQNLSFGLYYDPPSRPCRSNISVIGVYRNKRVIAVGRLLSVGVFSFSGGKISDVDQEHGIITADQRERLLRCIAETHYYDLGHDDLRAYFVDAFIETDLTKVSPGGMMGMRYLDLEEMLLDEFRADLSTQQIAEALKGKTFE